VSLTISFIIVMLIFLVALLLLPLLVNLFIPMLMRTISNIVTMLTTIVASPLGLCSKLVFLVSFEKILLGSQGKGKEGSGRQGKSGPVRGSWASLARSQGKIFEWKWNLKFGKILENSTR
jgi:hypothetical protein